MLWLPLLSHGADVLPPLPSSCPSSTIFKQMKVLFGAGFSEQDRVQFKSVIFSNTIGSMRSLCAAADKLGIEVAYVDGKAMFEEEVGDDDPIDDRVAQLMTYLWQDPGVQEAYRRRAEFQLADSADYFFGRLEELQNPEFLPNDQDIMRSRVKTTGIVEEKYVIEGVEFIMFDVGGQRNERKKWIHCFENVTAVIFVAAISEYDQVLYEDHTQNRMVEALNLFDEICNLQWFTNTSMILFLNKRDLFEVKIAEVDIRDEASGRFLDYDGGCDYDAGSEYFTRKFKECNKSPDEKTIFHHVTCATDTDNVDVVFHGCTEIILRENLGEAGLQ